MKNLSWQTISNLSVFVLIICFCITIRLYNKNEELVKTIVELNRQIETSKTKPIKNVSIKFNENNPYITVNTIAIENKNPLNIKALKNAKWKGQKDIDEWNHVKFESFDHGIRAGAFVLVAYAKKHNIDTIENIVKRFCTGNQKQYINFLCYRLKLKPNEKFNILKRLPELLQAMTRFESGQEFPIRYFIHYDLITIL